MKATLQVQHKEFLYRRRSRHFNIVVLNYICGDCNNVYKISTYSKSENEDNGVRRVLIFRSFLYNVVVF